MRLALRAGSGAPADRAQPALDAARRAGPVNHFAFERRSLAEVFLTTVGRPVAGGRRCASVTGPRRSSPCARSARPRGRRAFRVTLVLSAIALAAIIVIANLGRDGDEVERIVVAGPDAAARVEAIEQLGQAVGVDVEVTTAPTTPPRAAAVRRR